MSERHEPTLADVLAAVTGLGERFTGLGERFTGLDERFTGLDDKVTKLDDKVEAQGRKHDELRVALMDRMQNALTERTDDVSVLLDLLLTNQKIAERGLSEARFGVDRQSSMATTMATFERQLRRLRDEVQELRDRH